MRPHLSRNLSLAEEKSIPEIIGKIFKQTGNGKFFRLLNIISNEVNNYILNKKLDTYADTHTVKNQNYLLAYSVIEIVMVYVRFKKYFNYI